MIEALNQITPLLVLMLFLIIYLFCLVLPFVLILNRYLLGSVRQEHMRQQQPESQRLMMEIRDILTPGLERLVSVVGKVELGVTTVSRQLEMLRQLDAITDRLTGLMRNLESIAERLPRPPATSIEAAPLPVTEQVREDTEAAVFRQELVEQYNRAMLGEPRERERFLAETSAERVQTEDSAEAAKGIYRSEKYKPRLRVSPVGTLLVLGGKAEGSPQLLFPHFDVKDIYTPSVSDCFSYEKGDPSRSPVGSAWQLARPAMCQKVSGNEWQLVQKGELRV